MHYSLNFPLNFKDINQKFISPITGQEAYKHSYCRDLYNRCNQNLLNNVLKCFEWIEKNYPTLCGEFKCEHQFYYHIQLVVDNGKAYLQEGDHVTTWNFLLCKDYTASRMGSYSHPDVFKELFFRNDRLEEFLLQWQSIKSQITGTYNAQKYVFSDKFEA